MDIEAAVKKNESAREADSTIYNRGQQRLFDEASEAKKRKCCLRLYNYNMYFIYILLYDQYIYSSKNIAKIRFHFTSVAGAAATNTAVTTAGGPSPAVLEPAVEEALYRLLQN